MRRPKEEPQLPMETKDNVETMNEDETKNDNGDMKVLVEPTEKEFPIEYGLWCIMFDRS
jgi:hypothetical protein